MSEPCLLCQIVEGRIPSKVIYEDDVSIAILDFSGAAIGHTFIVPKAHHTIFEQVPDDIVARVFENANKVSSTLFESLEVQGTNIFVANGIAAGQQVPHFFVHVIPRVEGDGIDIQWAPKQLGEEEMSTIELTLKEQIKDVVSFVEEKKKSSPIEKKTVIITSKKGEDNYLVKQIKRIP